VGDVVGPDHDRGQLRRVLPAVLQESVDLLLQPVRARADPRLGGQQHRLPGVRDQRLGEQRAGCLARLVSTP
jgi:hypothetical protein